MAGENKILIAAAGSGKTSFLVDRALEVTDSRSLIVTYTLENAEEIRRAIFAKKGTIPSYIEIQTWFSFLIRHCVKPFQFRFASGLHNYNVNGMLLVNEPSALDYKYKKNGKEVPVYFKETDVEKHFFSSQRKLYSDKISKFAVGGGNAIRKTPVLKELRAQFRFEIFDRLSRIYSHIFVDEVQDLAGYDLEFLKLLFESSINVLLAGDPRQVTYLTHHEAAHKKYRNGRIVDFIRDHCKKCFPLDNIDETTLAHSHRNNRDICIFSSRLYENLRPSEPCSCKECRSQATGQLQGVFAVSRNDRQAFLSQHQSSMQLRDKISIPCLEDFPAMNFGESKGRSFESVLIYPTANFKKWLKNSTYALPESSRAKFYVAITRARHSVGIVCDEPINCEGLVEFKISS